MSGQPNWQIEARDERGRWTAGEGGVGSVPATPTLRFGVDAALLGMARAIHDGLDHFVGHLDRVFRSNIAGSLPSGKADGVSVLTDTLNQVLVNTHGQFGRAAPEIVAALREVASGLRPGRSGESRSAAVAKLQDMLSRPTTANQIIQAMREVEETKLANIDELARVLENEAGSTVDQPIMEAVGHTVLNRMQRNETNLVTDVSGRYSRGRNSSSRPAVAMFGKFLLAMLLMPFAAHAQDRKPFGPPGYELPNYVTAESLNALWKKTGSNDCGSSACFALRAALAEVLTNSSQRKDPGTGEQPAIPYGAIKARDIDRSLGLVKAIWPDICRAVVEIGARDDFVHGNEKYSWIAAAALDVSRHLTQPGLDCLGQALAEMPQSKHLQASMHTAWVYCLDERRGAARCARLKPTDPDFLPAKPY